MGKQLGLVGESLCVGFVGKVLREHAVNYGSEAVVEFHVVFS